MHPEKWSDLLGVWPCDNGGLNDLPLIQAYRDDDVH